MHPGARVLGASPAPRSSATPHTMRVVTISKQMLWHSSACLQRPQTLDCAISLSTGLPETCVGAKRRVRGVEAVCVVRIAGLARRAAAGGER